MYKRVLLKLSGEALSSPENAFEPKVLTALSDELKKVTESGVQVGIVVGGGNIIRGKFASQLALPRVSADKMGMLGTVINALAIQGVLEANGMTAYLQSAVEVPRCADVADARKAIQHLEAGEIVVFGGGTGLSSMWKSHKSCTPPIVTSNRPSVRSPYISERSSRSIVSGSHFTFLPSA